MRECALLLAVLLLVGCAADVERPQLTVSHARLIHHGGETELMVGLDYEPSALQWSALEHGVPLGLVLRVGGRQEQVVRLSLRYFPLSRRYQLRTRPGDDHSFAVRGYMLDALQNLRLALPDDPCLETTVCRLQAGLDHSRLPGALRLPALLRPGWHAPQVEVNVEVLAP